MGTMFNKKLAEEYFNKYNFRETDHYNEKDYFWNSYAPEDSDYEIMGVSTGEYVFTLEGDELTPEQYSQATGIPVEELELIGELIQSWAEEEREYPEDNTPEYDNDSDMNPDWMKGE